MRGRFCRFLLRKKFAQVLRQVLRPDVKSSDRTSVHRVGLFVLSTLVVSAITSLAMAPPRQTAPSGYLIPKPGARAHPGEPKMSPRGPSPRSAPPAPRRTPPTLADFEPNYLRMHRNARPLTTRQLDSQALLRNARMPHWDEARLGPLPTFTHASVKGIATRPAAMPTGSFTERTFTAFIGPGSPTGRSAFSFASPGYRRSPRFHKYPLFATDR